MIDQSKKYLFFAEYVKYDDLDERAFAYQYLNLWQHFTMKRLAIELPDYIYQDQNYVDRNGIKRHNLKGEVVDSKPLNTLALKMCYVQRVKELSVFAGDEEGELAPS